MVASATAPDGSAATFPLIAIEGVRDGPTAVLTGGIHGDEYEGPASLMALADAIDPVSVSGRILIIPIANLAAFGAGTRTSPIDGQNLARIFPGDPGGTLSFRLAHALFEIVLGADLLIDCHSGGVRLEFAEVAGFYPPGGGISPDAAAASLELAKAMGLARLWRLAARDGVLTCEAARRGIAAIGGEIGGRGGLRDHEADAYRAAILRVLTRKGMLTDAEEAPVQRYAHCLDGDWALAPTGGFILNHVAVGERVETGRRLATIRSPLGDVLDKMHACHPGFVMGVRHLRTITAGEWATCVVREDVL
jgi:predicted deacylase